MDTLSITPERSFESSVNLYSKRVTHFDGIGMNRWNVGNGEVTYYKPSFHTISLYLEGGESTFRKDLKEYKGGKGKLCAMPLGHQSKWSIQDNIDFLHFYFSDHVFKSYVTQNFDVDVRTISIRDLVYADQPEIMQLLLRYYKISEVKSEALFLEKDEVMNDLLHHIVINCTDRLLKSPIIIGGLSHKDIKRIRIFIRDNLEKSITLNMLANELNLSPFHFAKMFKISFGQTPAQYTINCRIERIKELLKTTNSLADISSLAGFCHQSHMTALFKRQYGITPSAVRCLNFEHKPTVHYT